MSKLISIIYSFRNEEGLLSELIERTIKSMGEYQFEIIFVNDNSTDNSLEVIQGYSKADSRIKIINMSGRFGQIPCLIAGLRAASGEAVLYCDSDLQDPPELFPKLIKEWEEGADVVNMVRSKRSGENPLKMLLTKMAYKVWNKCSKIRIQVEVGDFKLVDKKVLSELCKIKEEDPFLRGYVQWLGYKQVNLVYEREARHSGETHYPFFGGDPIETFFIGLTSFSITPLYLPLIFMFFPLIGLILYFLSSSLINLWIIGIFVMFFLNFLSLLILGVYVGRIHLQSRKRPLYNIKSTENL
ncbi:MAG: dolichol-phosphate mannosyltransferase [Bacteriovoracaceae bacterium]|jgi:dolichol-phosphate mannosyltransferase